MACLNESSPQCWRVFTTDGAGPCLNAGEKRGGAPTYSHPVCFAQNTRDEVRIVQGGVCGALAAQPGMKQQNYVVLVAGRVD